MTRPASATVPPTDRSDAGLPADGPTALVAMGHAVLRIENETLAQIAIQRPRDEARVLAGALKELEMVPEEASRAYYEIPYRNTDLGGEQRMVKVTGPSIKAATALARRWGNCSATARILTEDPDSLELEGVFIDFESSVRFTRPHRVSKWMKTKRGVILLDPKRLEATVGAGASKAMRNAILLGLPAYLVSAYDRRAREIAGGKAEIRLDAKTVAAIVKAFGEFKVTDEQLAAYLEKPAAEWTGGDRASLIGVFNALKDGQTTVEEVFGGGTADETSGPATPTTVTPESLAGGTATAENGVEPGSDPARPAALSAQESLLEQTGAGTPPPAWVPPDPSVSTLTSQLLGSWEQAIVTAPTRGETVRRFEALERTAAFKKATPSVQASLRRARDARLAEIGRA